MADNGKKNERYEDLKKKFRLEIVKLNAIYEVTVENLVEMTEARRADFNTQLRISKGFYDVLVFRRSGLKGLVEKRKWIAEAISEFETKIERVEKRVREETEYHREVARKLYRDNLEPYQPWPREEEIVTQVEEDPSSSGEIVRELEDVTSSFFTIWNIIWVLMVIIGLAPLFWFPRSG